MVKRIWQPGFFIVITGIFLVISADAQVSNTTQFVDASMLTMIGKAFPDAPLYHRVDTSGVEGLSASENQQARCAAGLAIVFSTNSSYINLLPSYHWKHKKDNITGIAAAGFDLYIKKADKWLYAGTTSAPVQDSVITIVSGMDTTVKECMLYLPLYSELSQLKIGIHQNAIIKSIPNPFNYKMVFFGSSFTQGTSVSRPGMSFPLQIGRMLNIEVCNLGFAGNAKLQTYFAEMVASVQADAIVFDAFSNPTDLLIKERLESFIAIIAKKQSRTPLIFLHTLYRGNNNFNERSRSSETRKRKAAIELMAGIMRKYPNVYFLENPLSEEVSGDMSADGVHPSDLGYQYIAMNLSTQLQSILEINKRNK